METPRLLPSQFFSKSPNSHQFRLANYTDKHPADVDLALVCEENSPPRTENTSTTFLGLEHIQKDGYRMFANSRRLLHEIHQESLSDKYRCHETRAENNFDFTGQRLLNAAQLFPDEKMREGDRIRRGDIFSTLDAQPLSDFAGFRFKQETPFFLEPAIPSLDPIFPTHDSIPPLLPITGAIPSSLQTFQDSSFLHPPSFPPMYNIPGDRQKSFSDLVQRISKYGTR